MPKATKRFVSAMLLQAVRGLGAIGDTVRVSPGYARNFLLPQKVAVYATKTNLQKMQAEVSAQEAELREKKRIAEETSARLSKLKLGFKRQSNDGNTLYGSVTAEDIERALRTKMDLGFGPRAVPIKVLLEHPLKALGTHSIAAECGGKTVELKVDVAKR